MSRLLSLRVFGEGLGVLYGIGVATWADAETEVVDLQGPRGRCLSPKP